MTSTFPRRLARKIRQTRRLSRKSIAFLFLLAGSALVALTALFFAHLADFALELNAKLVQQYPWFAWIALPPGLPVIVWLTRKFAPFTAGSGIPQVIASLSLPYGAQKTRLIRLGQTLLKIPLTFLGMLFGASIGREGPSVQVGAAVMGAWGAWCKKHGLAFKGMQENDLMAAGAAGGLAAAFNAPLAGVIFAIEELGRGIMLRWERQILLGVLAAGNDYLRRNRFGQNHAVAQDLFGTRAWGGRIDRAYPAAPFGRAFGGGADCRRAEIRNRQRGRL